MRRAVIVIAALSMLLVPTVSLAQDNGKPRCDVPEAQQDDACKKQLQGGFRTKFFN